jgi:hypothetical protein
LDVSPFKFLFLSFQLGYPDYNNIQLNKRLQLQDQMGIVIPRVKYNNIDKPNTDEVHYILPTPELIIKELLSDLHCCLDYECCI